MSNVTRCPYHGKYFDPLCPECIYPKGFFVEAASDMTRAYPTVLPFTSVLAASGENVRLETQPPFVTFRPRWLVIAKHLGTKLVVTDVTQDKTHLFGSRRVLSASCFRDTLAENIRIKLDWHTMNISQIANMNVTNISSRSVRVFAYLLGVASK